MMVTVKEVVSGKDLREFLRFPYKLYKDNPYWIPSLDFDEKNTLSSKINPAFDFCRAKYWLAYKDGKVVGRIAGIINDKYIEIWKKKHARFGWVDFIDDQEVSSALIGTVEKWAKENKMDAIEGPLGFTDFDKEGTLVEGFEELGTIAGIYNYPYYPEHFERLSLVKEVDWLEFQINLGTKMNNKMKRIGDMVEKKLKLRAVRFKKNKDILPYTNQIFDLLNETYKDLFGFIPLSPRQKEFYAKQYFSLINPEFVMLVVDSDNKIAGFALSMPSLSVALKKANGKLLPFGFIHLLRAMRKNNKVDVLLITVRSDLQGKGVNAMLMREGNRVYMKYNITIAEASHQLETNKNVLSAWDYFESRQHKRRRCYKKSLN